MTVQDIIDLKAEVKRLSTWDNSGIAFGQIDQKAGNTKDSMFEFYCLVWLLNQLGKNYLITFVPGGKNTTSFPMKPGKKADWPYFKLVHKEKTMNDFQVCYGTKIEFSFAKGSGPSPDISLQNINSTVAPTEVDVLLIFDAKYTGRQGKKLAKSTLEAFMQWVNSLELKDPKALALDFGSVPDFKGNCLITNGKAIDKHLNYCLKFKVRQIGNFRHDNSKYEVVG
jgi:hypothetical protein